MEVRFATDDAAADINWLLGTEYKIDTSTIKMDSTKIQLTIIGLIIAFGLNHS